MSADFNIGIVSKLQIDPKSSAVEINKVIKSDDFKNNLNKVPIKLEAYMTQAEQKALKRSIGDILNSDQVKGSKVKVGVEVNENEAVKAINSSLKKAAKKLNKIKIDIDAQVDEKKLREKLKPKPSSVIPPDSSSPLGTSSEESGKKRTKAAQDNLNDSIRQGNGLSKETKAIVDNITDSVSLSGKKAHELAGEYKNVAAFAKDAVSLVEAEGSVLDHTIKDVSDLSNGYKRVTLEVRRYNEELKKIESHRIQADLGESGKVVPKSYAITDDTESQNTKSRYAAREAMERAIITNEKFIAQGSPIKASLESQITTYKKYINSLELTNQEAKELIATNTRARIAAEQQAKAVQLQEKLQHQMAKAMQQNARYIDKNGMNTLLGQIKRVDVASNTALPKLKAMQAEMQGYVNKAAQATRSQMGIIENFQNAMLKFPIWMGASTLFFGAIASGKEFITTIIDIDTKMTSLQKVVSDGANMDETFNDASVAAERFGQTLSDVLESYAEFARQGYEGADLSNFGNAALMASNVGEVSAQTASEYLTAASAQWLTDSQQAMGQVDSWNNIANNYATTVEKLGEGQAKAGSSARAMGLDFDETNAVIGALTAQTKQSGSEIGNFIKAVFPRAYTVSANVFDDLGISLNNANGETKSAIALYREAAHAMEGMNQADQAEIVKGLGGTHHYQRMQVLLDTLRETDGLYDQILDSSRNAEGSAAQENAIYMQSLEANINKAKVAIEEFSLSLGEAFLESGILTFLTEFVNGMSLLTKAFTDLNPIVRNLGMGALIATLAGGIRPVRQFYGALNNIPDAFQRIRKEASLAAASNNIGNPATFATGAMANASTNSIQQGMMLSNITKTAENAQKQATGTTKTYTSTISTLANTQKAANVQTTASVLAANLSAKANRGAAAATSLLAASWRGLMAATGVGLVIGGITLALEKLVNSSAKATEAANEFAQTQDILKQSMEQDSESVTKLADDYQRLSEKMSSGNYSDSELVRFKEVSQEMASLFPDLISGSDEYGTSLVNQESVIEARIALVERQIQAEKELAEEQRKSATQAAVDAGLDAEKDIDSELGKVTDRLSTLTSGRSADPAVTAERQQEIESIQNINDLLEFRNTIEQRGRDLKVNDPQAYETEKFYINDMLDAIDMRSTALQALNQTAIAGLTGAGEQFMANTQEIISQASGLDAAAMGMMGNLANQVTALGLTTGETKAIFTSLEDSLSADTGFQEKMASYEAAVQKFQNAASREEEFAALKEIETAFEGLASNITDSMSAMDLPDEQIQKVIASLRANTDELQLLEDAYGQSGTIKDYIAHMIETESSTEGATDAINAQQEAIKGLTDMFRELDGQMGTIQSAMDELAETGFIDTSTMYDLIELYPELLGQQMTAAEMQGFLQEKHNELNNQKIQNYENELLTSKAVMSNIIADEDHKLQEVAKRYGLDLSNYSTVAAAKEGLAALYNEGTVEQQNKVVDALGERYGVDLSNFGDLASKKAAIEAELMAMITDAWNAHIVQLQALSPELDEFLKDYQGAEGIKAAQEIVDNQPLKSQIGIGALPALDTTGVTTKVNTLRDALSEIKPMYNDLVSVEFGEALNLQAGKAADGLFGASDAGDILGSALNGLGDSGDVVGSSLAGAGDKARKGMKDAEKATKKAEKAAKDAKDSVKDLNIEAETLTKTFQKQTFVLNEHEERLRRINHQIEKQNLQTQRYASHSANYRKALQKENKLNQEKLKAMQAQEKSLESQIKKGRINEYGLVSSDVNVKYNQYNTSTSGSGSETRKTGQVKAAGGSGKVSPFAGWKINYGYSPQGGGAYGAQIGYNNGKHFGVDFGGKTGQAIRTPHGGTVVKAGWSSYGGGNQVEVYNKAMNKTFTFMHMLGDLAVKTGQTIQAGQQVGRMGSTGNSTGTHLHFQVNNGRGINNAASVNPNAYLTSGGSSFVGAAVQSAAKSSNISTGTPSQLGKSISEETASYLNDVEKARLDAIENAINAHNAGEENKSKVQEARERLDKMELERLQLVAQIREIEFNIIESQLENYEVSKNKLNHKISELEYKADNNARLKGKTSDSKEWRKWMNKAQTEREKQLKFQEQQISYLNKVLSADARKNPANRMNEAHRFQLEERLRSAKEEVINLNKAVNDSERNIMASRVNQTMTEMDEALEKVDKQITLLTHKRHFLDSTYADGAKDYTKSLEKEIALHKSREDELQKSMKTLKNLRSNLKQQPELYQQVNDKIDETEDGLRAVQTVVYDLNKEIQSLRIDKVFEQLNDALETSQKRFKDLENELHFIDREMQSDLFFNNQADSLKEMDKYKQTIEDNIDRLKKMKKEVKEFPDLHKRVSDELKNWETQYQSVAQEMHTMRKDFASSFVTSIKAIYQTQKDEAIKAIDKETSEFEKMINKKIELIDKQAKEENYQDNISDKQEELQKLRNEIAQRQGDDSLENQRIMKDLREELEKAEKDYNKFITDKQREDQKEALQEEISDAQEAADAKKESTTKAYDDLLNDQRAFNEMQEEIMKGQIDKYKGVYKELTDFVGENMKEIGRSLSEGLLDSINTPYEALLKLTDLLKTIKKEDVPVLESGLRPTAPKLDSTLSELMKGVDNNFTLQNLGLSPTIPSLNKNQAPASNTTNNNNNNFNALLNIETFRGTKSEQDKLLNNIIVALRKQGVII